MKESILVAYYSWSGNTRKVAEAINSNVGGEIFEIIPKDEYPSAYNAVVAQAKKEIKDGFMPELETCPDSLDKYDTIFIGSPNWWSTLAPPVAAFIKKYDFSGKTVVPFCTHGGGGQARVLKDIAAGCEDSRALSGFTVYEDGGAGAKDEIYKWLCGIGIVH